MAMMASSSTMSTRISHRCGWKRHRQLNAVTLGDLLCFHIGIKLGGEGVNNARPQPQPLLMLCGGPCPVSEIVSFSAFPTSSAI